MATGTTQYGVWQHGAGGAGLAFLQPAALTSALAAGALRHIENWQWLSKISGINVILVTAKSGAGIAGADALARCSWRSSGRRSLALNAARRHGAINGIGAQTLCAWHRSSANNGAAAAKRNRSSNM
jgi:hypothetical protein